jgi:hypothetical protein
MQICHMAATTAKLSKHFTVLPTAC